VRRKTQGFRSPAGHQFFGGGLIPVFDAMLEEALRYAAAFGMLSTYHGARVYGAALCGVLDRSSASGRITQCPWLLAGDSVVHVIRVGTERQKYAQNFHHHAEPGKYGSADFESELRRTVENTNREMRFGRTRPNGQVIEGPAFLGTGCIRRYTPQARPYGAGLPFAKPGTGARRFAFRPKSVNASASHPDLDKNEGSPLELARMQATASDPSMQRCSTKYGMIAAKRVYRPIGDKIERGPQRFCVPNS
jgi:hypothetical protein